MKNLKKVLALALTFALSLTLFAGAAFTDEAEIGVNFQDDVNMLVQLGVINGYEDNTFRPQKTITRAEYAKMAYTLKYGYDDQGKLFVGQKSTFTDVEGNANIAWAKGYINYCANQNIVGGVGNNKFNPNGNVTVAEAAKMLLVILGADPVKENYGGANWIGNVTADAMELGVFDGWVGDPTEAATRELVAKLMRNTIFAPMYLYNPITGIGSQVSALDPTVENETLGEKTMGLKHVEGIIVSNDRFALETDPNGEFYGSQSAKKELQGIDPSVQAKGNAQIAYKITNAKSNSAYSNGDYALLPLEEVYISDEAVGTLVNVYFKADGDVGTYSNVEVIGDILTSAKTVVYEVMSGDVNIMPDGESTSSREIKPYIEFTTAEGETKTVTARNTFSTTRVNLKTDYSLDPVAFYDRMYYSATTAKAESGLDWIGADANAKDHKMVKELGKNYMQKYRFVSVDGGASYSYIFRTTNMETGKVGTMSDISINVAGAGTYDLETEAVVAEGVAKGMQVVYWAQDDMLFVEPTSIITGQATNLKDVEATINGEVYVSDLGSSKMQKKNIAQYFVDVEGGMSANNANTQYTVYKNYVIEIDTAAVTGNASDYALILYSSYDADMGTAKAKFVFADGSEGTYELGDLWGNEKDDLGYMKNFRDNQLFGALARVKIVNGVANITAAAPIENKYNDDKAAISAGALKSGGKTYLNDGNSIVYLVYGGKHNGDGTYESVKAKPYKLAYLDDQNATALEGVNKGAGNYNTNWMVSNAVKTSGNTGINSLLIGAMSVGANLDNVNAKTENIAYVLESVVRYDGEADEYYFDIAMVTENGPIVTRTVNDVRKDSGAQYFDTTPTIGDKTVIKAGSIVAYKLTAVEGEENEWIESIGTNSSTGTGIGEPSAMEGNPFDSNNNLKNGYWKVTVGVVRNDLIGFWKYGEEMLANSTWQVNYTAQTDEHDFAVIAIDDNNWVEGGEIETVSDGDTWGATDYNAIIVVEGGKITRVISLYGNIN